MLKSLARPALLAIALVASASTAQAQVTQTVTYAVNAINQIAFTGAPSLTITTAVAGSAPTSVTNSASTWAITTNQATVKISASIASAMPTGLTLNASLAAPTLNGVSAGFLALGTTAVDLVTAIDKLAQSGMAVSYRLDATAAAGVVTSATKIVTYTISGGT